MKRSCINGHRMNDENSYITPQGHRQCRICRRAREKRKRKRLKEIERLERTGNMVPQSMERRGPRAAAAIIEAASDPFERIEDAARAVGMPSSAARFVVERARTKHQAVTEGLRKVRTADLVALMEDRTLAALEAITPSKLDEASAYHLALIAGVLTDKRQLLKGEPTQILSYQEREGLDKLVPQMILEAKRRGVVTEAEFEVVGGPEPEQDQ